MAAWFKRHRSSPDLLAATSPGGGVRPSQDERLDYGVYVTPGFQYRHDEVVEKVGLEVYRQMFRDPVVASSLRRRVVATMPGFQIQQAGADERAQRMAALVSAVCGRVSGGFLQAMQTLLMEGEGFGFAISEVKTRVLSVADFGSVVGIEAVKVRPSETFQNGFKTDRFGNIESILQNGSNVTVTPDQVWLYIHDQRPGTIEGTSILYSAHDAWKARVQTWRAWQIFLDRAAGGLWVARAPGDKLKQLRASLETILTYLSTGSNAILPEEAKIERLETAGQAGMLYKAAQDFLKGEIRAAILGTEDANATITVGSYAREKAQQDAMYAEIQADAQTFAEWIRETIFRWILRANGFDDEPPLCIPESKVTPDGNPAEVLAALGNAKTQGTLTINIPLQTQAAIVNAMLQHAGLEPIAPDQIVEKPAAIAPVPDEPPAPGAPAAAMKARREASQRARFAASRKAPPGRGMADIARIEREWKRADDAAAVAVSEVWQKEIAPALVETINAGIWNRDGSQKLTGWSDIRALVEKAVRTKGQRLSTVLLEHVDARYRAGVASAAEVLPAAAQAKLPASVKAFAESASKVKAAGAVPGGKLFTPTAALDALRNDVYIAQARYYADIQEQVYYSLRQGILSGAPARDIVEDLYSLTAEDGMTMGRAQTLVNTELTRAFAEGRQSLFTYLETADTNSTEPYAIIGYESVAIMDDVTTQECFDRNGLFFTVGEAAADPIPRHYNCRSMYVPLFAGEEPWTERGWWDGSPLTTPGFQRGAE